MGGGGGIIEDIGDFVQDEIIDPVKEVGRDVDDFVNDEIPGGWYTVGAVVGANYLGPELLAAESATAAGAAETAALAGTAETAAATGAFDAGLGLDAMAGGSGIVGGTSGAALGGGTGLKTSQIAGIESVSGTEGLLGAGQTVPSVTGATAPTLPTAGGMGGSGLSTSAIGKAGTITASGVTAAGAVPMLGSAGSFINNPAVIGNPVVGYVAGPNYTLMDAFRGAQLANSLFARPQQPQVNPYQLMQQQQQAGLVDYTPTLNLLASRTQQRNPFSLV